MTVPGDAAPATGDDPDPAQGTDPDAGPADTVATTPDPVAVTPRPPIDKALLDRIFGTTLPEVTRDELPERSESRGTDDWYRENRPPHHGG
ncbi:hypothetical protein GIS00_01310 [Nakamurella sp. YIM 132087]|uniref:Uncharacterized protein n=1 Tax=Nakamurella alba TaxID=2665158 RepID=A0A7K1FEP9_9ACTN|nr:hypothetical protein [Nakamurella alba]MTD12582.1 hypothetical protein [Nakamurella alba]